MAKATYDTVVTRTTTVTLTLSAEEAGTLAALIGRCVTGGGPREPLSHIYGELDALDNGDVDAARAHALCRMTNRPGQTGPIGVHFKGDA